MSAPEWARWRALDNIEPIGDIRGDLQAGMICAMLYNANRGKGKAAKKPSDFMPIQEMQRRRGMEINPGEPTQTVAQMKTVWLTFVALHNAKIKRNKKRK